MKIHSFRSFPCASILRFAFVAGQATLVEVAQDILEGEAGREMVPSGGFLMVAAFSLHGIGRDCVASAGDVAVCRRRRRASLSNGLLERPWLPFGRAPLAAFYARLFGRRQRLACLERVLRSLSRRLGFLLPANAASAEIFGAADAFRIVEEAGRLDLERKTALGFGGRNGLGLCRSVASPFVHWISLELSGGFASRDVAAYPTCLVDWSLRSVLFGRVGFVVFGAGGCQNCGAPRSSVGLGTRDSAGRLGARRCLDLGVSAHCRRASNGESPAHCLDPTERGAEAHLAGRRRRRTF